MSEKGFLKVLKDRTKDAEDAATPKTSGNTPTKKPVEYVPSTKTRKTFSDGTVKVWDDEKQDWVKE